MLSLSLLSPLFLPLPFMAFPHLDPTEEIRRRKHLEGLGFAHSGDSCDSKKCFQSCPSLLSFNPFLSSPNWRIPHRRRRQQQLLSPLSSPVSKCVVCDHPGSYSRGERPPPSPGGEPRGGGSRWGEGRKEGCEVFTATNSRGQLHCLYDHSKKIST